MSTPPPNHPLLRNLGAFVGHILQGVKSDPAPNAPSGATTPPANPPTALDPPAKAIRQISQEHEITTPDGKLILRRTIIDEVEQRPEDAQTHTDQPRP